MSLQTHHVYRVYDANRRLIYIGATGDLDARMRLHEAHTWWYDLAAWVEAEPYPNRSAAFAAEAVSIQEGQPAFNVMSTGRPYGDFAHLTPDDLSLCQRWLTSHAHLAGKVSMGLRDFLAGYLPLHVAA